MSVSCVHSVADHNAVFYVARSLELHMWRLQEVTIWIRHTRRLAAIRTTTLWVAVSISFLSHAVTLSMYVWLGSCVTPNILGMRSWVLLCCAF